MQITAILALAAGASASFTKVVRQAPVHSVAGNLDLYSNSNCAGDAPREVINYVVVDTCYNLESGPGSVFLHAAAEAEGCIVTLYDEKECQGITQVASDFSVCAVNTTGKAFLSARVTCPAA